MGQRLSLQMMLEDILGSKNVYYQPPETVKLKYPCIIYELDEMDSFKADNIKYYKYKVYSVMVIYKNADSDLPDLIDDLPMCIHQRSYTSNNLYHDVFRLYF